MAVASIMWPDVPPGLKYMEIRLPGTFRELASNRKYSDDEIGKIVRCLLLDTDMGVTAKIEPEVMYYREYLNRKTENRIRVMEYRRRKKLSKAGDLSHKNEALQSVTVTDQPCEPLSIKKTPTIPEEKTPPIVPLEKNIPSSLEKKPCVRAKKGKKGSQASIQDDLFSAAFGTCDIGRTPEIAPDPPRSPVEPSSLDGAVNAIQDIETAPTAVPVASDMRDDAAWIPARFAVFWARYPKKVAKADAMKAFTKLIKAQSDVERFMDTLLASLEWWKCQQQWTKDKGKFIPNPATWLNRGSWEDIKDNGDSASGAQFLRNAGDSDEELIRRMQGG